MKTLKHSLVVVLAVVCLFGWNQKTFSADGSVQLQVSGTNVIVKVDGDKDDDWRMQVSTNLSSWTTVTSFGTILSGNETNAPWRSIAAKSAVPTYYRALQTAGLYDPTVFRTISMTFTQTSLVTLSNQLVLARTYSTNVYGPLLTMDNGATNYHIGARYKGNTSFTMGGTKKSFNIEFDSISTNADLMGYTTLNLNNAAGDETIMREPLYFTLMSQYCCSPKAALARVYINGSDRGVYSLAQQENSELIKEHFPSADGDRWRTPNPPTASAIYAFGYLGNTNVSSYLANYDLRSNNSTTNDAYARVINAINVLNNTATNTLRDAVEDVFAVDSWLWFLAIENIFVDDDSYFNKGADYSFYWEIESGRIHPVEHDGNESFAAVTGLNYTLSPVYGDTLSTRPLLYRLLPIKELRQRYLAHMRTVLSEYFNPVYMTQLINQFHALSIDAVIADPLKGYTMATYTNDLVALKTYITNRYNYLITHAELTPLQPNINSVTGPTATVYATNVPTIKANVTSNGSSGVGSVWLYFRDKPYGRFTVRQMFDDGAHGDGVAGDNVYGANTTNFLAGNKIHYYVEARATNAAQAARFAPARAEIETYNYSVALSTATGTSVVINEFMASNTGTLADPQGQYDDWIELRNLTGAAIDLTGLYLTDEPSNPRKWAFPSGTTIPANSYLLVWADENGTATPGLHASFKLSASGEQIYLIDSDANNNQVLDAITFGTQTSDVSYGRSAANADVWTTMTATPNAANQ